MSAANSIRASKRSGMNTFFRHALPTLLRKREMKSSSSFFTGATFLGLICVFPASNSSAKSSSLSIFSLSESESI